MEKNFRDFSKSGNKYVPNFTVSGATTKLPPGSYTLAFNQQTRTFWFEAKDITSDSIIDLPSPEYNQVINEMNKFLQPEVKAMFIKGGYVYKRSALLHGHPGTGKTVIVNRVAQSIIASGGICLWVNDPELLSAAFDILNDIQPNMLTGVIFEEFDGMMKRHESFLLTLLDGQVQKNNVIYLATTNYLDRIPARIYRPGRMSSVIEVHYPNEEARRLYFTLKLNQLELSLSPSDLAERVLLTDGLSVDELKEVIQAHDILGNPFTEVLARVRNTRKEDSEGMAEEQEDSNKKHRKSSMIEVAKLFKDLDLYNDSEDV